jgi:tRNA modification GTPase
MTAAVLLTPPAMGAIAVIRIAGPDARAVVARLASSRRVPSLVAGQTARTNLVHGDDLLDDALAVCITEDAFELHLHGGTAVVDATFAALAAGGAEVLTSAAARMRGFFGAGIAADLTLALPQAGTLTGARLLACQTDVGLAAWANGWRARLAANPQALWQFHSAAQWLLTRSAHLAHLLTPARIALIGPPNAGKSTLANALLGRPFAITSDTPGTTRDWIDAATTFVHGDIHIPVTLVDTAGIRETPDALERESIARTRRQAGLADVVILVVDAADEPLLEETFGPASRFSPDSYDLVALNKCDLLARLPAIPVAVPVIPLSARSHAHLPTLMSATLQQLDLADISADEPFAFAPRHTALLRALAFAADGEEALALLNTLLTA